MPKITYIEFNGTEHQVEVPVGISVMRGPLTAPSQQNSSGTGTGTGTSTGTSTTP